jgi:octaprenyl-diphosphate synthase
MEHASDDERKEMIELLKRCDSDEAALDTLHTMVHDGGGIERATETMQAYLSRAMHLVSKYEDTPYRKALIDLCTFVAERDK